MFGFCIVVPYVRWQNKVRVYTPVQHRYVGLYIMRMDLLVGLCILFSAAVPEIALSSEESVISGTAANSSCMFARKCT